MWIHGRLYRNVSGRFSTGKTSGQNRLSVRFKNECPARASLCPCLRVCPGVRDVGLVQAGEGSPGCETCPGVRAGGGVHALLNLSGRFHMSGGIVGALPQRSSGLRAMSGENLSWDMSGRWVLSQTAAVWAHATVRAKRKCPGYTTVRAARKRWLAGWLPGVHSSGRNWGHSSNTNGHSWEPAGCAAQLRAAGHTLGAHLRPLGRRWRGHS